MVIMFNTQSLEINKSLLSGYVTVWSIGDQEREYELQGNMHNMCTIYILCAIPLSLCPLQLIMMECVH